MMYAKSYKSVSIKAGLWYGLCVLLLLMLNAFDFNQTKTGKILVDVTNIRNTKGAILLALYSNPDDFPTKGERAFRTISAPISNHNASFVLESIPYGTYAIAIFHDENGNNTLDTNFLGIPKEGMGASRDAKGKMAPPAFEDAKFQVQAGSNSLKIKMAYYF